MFGLFNNNEKVTNLFQRVDKNLEELDKNCDKMLNLANSLPNSHDKQRILLSLHKQKAVISKGLNKA